MAPKVSSPIVTSQIPIIRFHSKHWFIFLKLSEIIRFSCVERHSSNKTNFKELILFYVGTNDFSIKVFQQKKIVQISLHLTF